MGTKIKSSQVKTFLNTTPSTTATYVLLGDGVTAGNIDMNPKTTDEVYINQDTGSVSVDSYAPKLAVEQTAMSDDPAFEFIDTLRKARSVLSDAESDIVNVWLYETPTGSEYPAEKQNVSIQVDSVTREGGKPLSIKYTLNYIDDPIEGTFNPTTKVFTPNP